MIVEVILACLALLLLVYRYCTSEYTYRKDRGVPYVEPHFPFGTGKDIMLMKATYSESVQNHYNKFKNEKTVGAFLFSSPYLIIRDLELIKHIMVKDFNHFVDRGIFDAEVLTPASRTLFVMEGEHWRNMRGKLTPAFTSGKMKMMFHLMEVCAEEFRKALHRVAEQNEKIDVKDFISRFTTDVISSCAFGLESNSIKNPDCEFRQNGKKMTQNPPLVLGILLGLAILVPRVYKCLRLPLVSNGMDDFFRKIVSDTVEYRENTGVVRNDFVDLLMKIRRNKCLSDDDKSETANATSDGKTEEGLTLDEMTAHSLVFFIAGLDTTANIMMHCLYELSVNPHVQEKLRKEVDDVLQRRSGKCTYQALQEMPYLDAVLNETLRRYTTADIVNRRCTEDYKLPDSNLVLPKGMNFTIPVYAIHHDPEYYPNPYKFDPERFMNDEKKTRNNFTFMPFGEGPRKYIGVRFAFLKMRTCLSMMINSFQISLSEDAPVPLKMKNTPFFTVPETPIMLKISNLVNE